MGIIEILNDVKKSKNILQKIPSKLSLVPFNEEKEILSKGNYVIFRGIMEKNLRDTLCYNFFNKVGFVPINMKENYLCGKEIYNQQKGHYILEDMN
jgi:hypothetical protein